MQKLLLVYFYSENRARSRIWKVLPNMFSPDVGKNWRRSEHAPASYPGGGKKGKFRDWTSQSCGQLVSQLVSQVLAQASDQVVSK